MSIMDIGWTVLFLLTSCLSVFRLAGATRCTDHGEIWQGGADRPPCQISLWSVQECGFSCIVDVHPYKTISLTHYRVPQKFLKFLQVTCEKAMSVSTFVITETVLSLAFFFLRRSMELPETRKFQTADLRILSARIIVIFWTTCIDREVCSLVVKGNRSCRYCSTSEEALLLYLIVVCVCCLYVISNVPLWRDKP